MENQFLGLQFLPPEILGKIAGFLSAQDVSACSATCSLLRWALNDDFLWKKKCSFKAIDYFKWGKCEIEPDFESEKNEPSDLPLPKVCTWRKYFMMQAHLWRNWEFGDYNTFQIEFGHSAKVFDGTQVVFYENDFLFLHSYDMTENPPKALSEFWGVETPPFLHSTLIINANQYLPLGARSMYDSRLFKCNIAGSKLVMSLDRLVLVYNINMSSFSQSALDYTFFFDGSDGACYEENETSIKLVSGDYFVGAKTRFSSQNLENNQLILYVWNVQTGEKLKEESIPLNNIVVESYNVIKSKDNKHLIVQLRVRKERFMYHYYGYNLEQLEFSQFIVKVNSCGFEVFFDDNVVGAGLHQLCLYSYKTSQKVTTMKCNHEILKDTIKIVGGYLLFGTFQNVVYVLNPTNLAVINKVKLGLTLYSLKPICDKFVLIDSTNSEVWKIGKAAKKLFQLPTDTSFAAVNQFGTKLAVLKRNKVIILNFW